MHELEQKIDCEYFFTRELLTKYSKAINVTEEVLGIKIPELQKKIIIWTLINEK